MEQRGEYQYKEALASIGKALAESKERDNG
jgi:hypothetical protein